MSGNRCKRGIATVLAGMLAAGGRGLRAWGASDDDGPARGDAADTQTVVSRRSDFPRPTGRSLRDLIGNMRQGPVLAPSVKGLEPGSNRFAFALFDRGNRQIGGLEVAVYVSRGVDETTHGPYAARYEPIHVEGKYRSRHT